MTHLFETRPELILTAKVGDSSDLFPDILALYVSEGATVADVTYGRGVFWKNIDAPKYKLLASDLKNGVDARQLPYQDSSIDAVVFDPPFMLKGGGGRKGTAAQYRNYFQGTEALLSLYKDAAKEAWRVLRPGGILILKCQDTVDGSHKQLWVHIHLMNLEGFEPIDLFILVRKNAPLPAKPKQIRQEHARKNLSYFLVHRKTGNK